MKPGSFINTNLFVSGSVRELKDFGLGAFICCIELRKNLGAKISRSAGCSSVVLFFDNKNVCLRLPSGEERMFYYKNYGVLGIVSFIDLTKKNKNKASKFFFLGRKPVVRGVAKNCVDHPHGGGRGKTSPLVLSSNFTRRVLKGVPSVKKKIIIKRSFFVKKERRKVNLLNKNYNG